MYYTVSVHHMTNEDQFWFLHDMSALYYVDKPGQLNVATCSSVAAHKSKRWDMVCYEVVPKWYG